MIWSGGNDFCLVGVAAADGQVQPVGEVVGRLGESGPGLVVELAAGTEVGNREIQDVDVLAVFVKVVAAENPVQPIVGAQQLQFLGELGLLQVVVELRNALRRMIAVAGELRIQVAPAADGLQRQRL